MKEVGENLGENRGSRVYVLRRESGLDFTGGNEVSAALEGDREVKRRGPRGRDRVP